MGGCWSVYISGIAFVLILLWGFIFFFGFVWLL